MRAFFVYKPYTNDFGKYTYIQNLYSIDYILPLIYSLNL